MPWEVVRLRGPKVSGGCGKTPMKLVWQGFLMGQDEVLLLLAHTWQRWEPAGQLGRPLGTS